MRLLPLLIAGLGLGLGLTACAAVRHQGVAPGSSIVLHRAVTVPAGSARVFLQAGAVLAKTRLNTYLPHCNLEVREVASVPLDIEPDTFTVRSVAEGEESVVGINGERYAARLRVTDDTPTMVSRYVHYQLHSPRQPQVLRLTCHGGMDFPGRALPPSLGEMRQALGGVLSINPVQ